MQQSAEPQKSELQAAPAVRRAVPATPPPRSQLARLAARMPQPSANMRSAGIRPVAAKTVGSFVPRLTRPAFEKYGFSAATLITDWATIVGADIARYTAPERLKWPRRVEDETADANRGRPGATLFLGVAEGRGLDVQYKTRQLIERINSYFGYAAISDLRIVQIATLPNTAKSGDPLTLGALAKGGLAPAQPAALKAATQLVELSGVADEGLRAALERMAAGLVSRKSLRLGAN